jgi:GntR family transcriptional regulator/MocR family aminotransferase
MLWMTLDRRSEFNLTRQIYEQIRLKILKQELRGGEKLPATRSLADRFKVSRNLFIEAYEQLAAEGYLETRGGSGTYVAHGAVLPGFKGYGEEDGHEDGLAENEKDPGWIDFTSGLPDLSLFPRKLFSRLTAKALSDCRESLLGYCDPLGSPVLRRSVSRYLLKTKGIQCRPEQVVIIPAIIESYWTIGRLFSSEKNEIIAEDPLMDDIQRIFKSLGYALHPVAVDEQGMRVADLPRTKRARFIHVTPSHQYPMACTMPVQRRVKLIEFAKDNDAYIIENDYDSEFQLFGPPISSLHLLDPERVIYLGTFSAVLCPAVRLAYMVMPEKLIPLYPLRELCGWVTPSFVQLAVARFIDEGHVYRHIHKMKKVYLRKMEAFMDCLEAHFEDRVAFHGDCVGSYGAVEFKKTDFNGSLAERMRKNKISFDLVERHAIRKGKYRNWAIFGFGNLPVEKIRTGISRLKKALG